MEKNCWKFIKKNCKRYIKQSLGQKVIKKRLINYMSNGKVMITILFAGYIAKILLQKMSYFPKSYTRSKNKEKVELVLSNYATKSD